MSELSCDAKLVQGSEGYEACDDDIYHLTFIIFSGGKTMALYSDKVMDHFRNPRNLGKLDDADGIGEVGNAKCGDIMRMYIKVDDGIITDVKFNTFGCGSAIATSSMATELIKGKPIEEALELSNKAVVEALDGLPTHKIHCSVLAEEAVRAAVKDYYDKNGIEYDPEMFKESEDPHGESCDA